MSAPVGSRPIPGGAVSLSLILSVITILMPPVGDSTAVKAGIHGSVLVVSASTGEMLAGYMRWMHSHPTAARTDSVPGQEAPAGGLLLIRVPSLDVYSPSGVSLSHQTDPAGDAATISRLPDSISNLRGDGIEGRPSLQEAVEMVRGLKPYEKGLLAFKGYTVFVLTYSDLPRCAAQNAAIEKLTHEHGVAGIRVVVLNLRVDEQQP